MNNIYFILLICCFSCSAQTNSTKLIIGAQSSTNFTNLGEIIFTPNVFCGISYKKLSFSAQLEHIGFIHGPKNKMIGLQGDYRLFNTPKRFSPLLRIKASTSFYSPYKNQLLTDYFEITTDVNSSIGEFQSIPLYFSPEILLDIKNDNWSVQVGTGYGNLLFTYLTSQMKHHMFFHSWQINVGFIYSFGLMN